MRLLLLLATAASTTFGGSLTPRANSNLCSTLAVEINDAACTSALRSLPLATCLGMIDACGKLPSGILQGNVYSLGSFDECKAYQSDGAIYARFNLNTTALSAELTPQLAQALVARPPIIGLCLPSDCLKSVAAATKGLLIDQPVVAPFGTDITAGAAITIAFLVVLTIVTLGASMVTMGELPGLCKLTSGPFWRWFEPFSFEQNLKSLLDLSIPPKRLVTSALEGMRVLSMQWVVIGHSFLLYRMNADNTVYVQAHEMKRWTMQTLSNGTYSVDTFFTLSGFLLAYVSLGKLHGMRNRQIAKGIPSPSVLRHAGSICMMVVHRWLRLVPSLGMVMLMNAQLLSHVSDGPYFQTVDQNWGEHCRKYWWTNLLFINNFHPSNLNDECVAQSWYLANDMQFFIFTMPLLFAFVFWEPLRTRLWARCAVIGAVVLSSIGATMGLVHKYRLTNTPVGVNEHDKDGTMANALYVQPQYRIGAYAVGVLAGVWFYWWTNERRSVTEQDAQLVPQASDIEQNEPTTATDEEERKQYAQFPPSTHKDTSGEHTMEEEHRTHVSCLCTQHSGMAWLGLLCCLATMTAILLALNSFENGGHPFTQTEDLMYGSLSRPAWAMAVAGVILGCALGLLPLVNNMLSFTIFVPLSKLTYGCYVLHLSVLAVVFDSSRSLEHWTDELAIFMYLGTLFITYILASLLFVLVDMPVSRLESKYLGRL